MRARVFVELCLYFVIHHGVENNLVSHNFTSIFILKEQPEDRVHYTD